MVNTPLFIGLSHIGQVYSFCWSNKINKCAAYDFDKNILDKIIKKKIHIRRTNS